MADYQNGNGKVRIDPSIALQIVAWVVAVIVAYGMVRADVAVLQTKYDRLAQDISEIKTDVRELLNRGRTQ